MKKSAFKFISEVFIGIEVRTLEVQDTRVLLHCTQLHCEAQASFSSSDGKLCASDFMATVITKEREM